MRKGGAVRAADYTFFYGTVNEKSSLGNRIFFASQNIIRK